jgi:hypothetical protein
MKEIKKPYNVYLITKEDGNEDLKFIQGIYEEPYKWLKMTKHQQKNLFPA